MANLGFKIVEKWDKLKRIYVRNLFQLDVIGNIRKSREKRRNGVAMNARHLEDKETSEKAQCN